MKPTSQMTAFSSPTKAISLILLLCHFQGITAGSNRVTKPSSSLAEERWVAEEEFHGASSTESQRRLDQYKKERGKDPQPSSSYPGHDNFGEHSWWDDDDDDGGEDDHERSPLTSIEVGKSSPETRTRKHRLRVWKNRTARKENTPSSPGGDNSLAASSSSSPTKESTPDKSPLTSDYDEEHPMRTDEWQLDVRLSRLFSKEEGDLFPEYCIDRTGQTNNHPLNRRGSYRKRQVMQFARNGYVKLLEDEGGSNPTTTGAGKKKKPRVGKWRVAHSGVAFDIPVQINVKRKRGGSNNNISRMTVLHYHADIHLNKFGERPRMFRGVITRDRHSSFLPPNFLRPVIGTFSAEGIGHDTADTSYKERAISLSRQQVINDARKELQ